MWFYFPVQASLSALVLMIAYMLQQRLRPFLVSRTLSDSLALDMKDIDKRLTMRDGNQWPLFKLPRMWPSAPT